MIGQSFVERMVVGYLRQEQIAGCKGYCQSHEVKHRCRLEATGHIEHVSEYVHVIVLFDY